MTIGETDVISVQKDPHSLIFTHVNNYCGRFKLFYLNDELRQGAALWTRASLANAALRKMAEGFCK